MNDDANHACFKTSASCVAWAASVLGSVAPVYMPVLSNACNEVTTMIVAGIFLLASIAHATPAMVETASASLAGVDFMLFPSAYSLYALGYLFVLGLEVLAHWVDVHVRSPRHKVRPSSSASSPPSKARSNAKHEPSCSQLSTSVVALFAVLSFHALVEGVGVGVAGEPAWTTLSGILAHKTMSSLVLSIETHHHYNEDRFKARRLASVLLFSLMTPGGVLLGSLASGPTTDLVCSVLSVLVAAVALHRVILAEGSLEPRQRLTAAAAAVATTMSL